MVQARERNPVSGNCTFDLRGREVQVIVLPGRQVLNGKPRVCQLDLDDEELALRVSGAATKAQVACEVARTVVAAAAALADRAAQPPIVFEQRGPVLLPLLPRDPYGQVIVPDGERVLSLQQAAEKTGEAERYLRDLWHSCFPWFAGGGK